jgi:hypothetical protein
MYFDDRDTIERSEHEYDKLVHERRMMKVERRQSNTSIMRCPLAPQQRQIGSSRHVPLSMANSRNEALL